MEGGGRREVNHRQQQQNQQQQQQNQQQQQHQQVLPFYHVPQQSRREKLRYPTTEIDLSPPPHLLPPHSATHNLFMSSSCSSSTPLSFPTLLNPNYSTTVTTSTATTPGAFFQQQHRHVYPHLQSGGGGVSLSLSSPYDNRNDGNDTVGDTIRTEGISRLAMVAPAPSEPFTGYAAVLKSSRFLKPAQQMLEEICSMAGCASVGGLETGGLGLDGPSDSSCATLAGVGSGSGSSGGEGRMKSRLISMLDEVYRRYKQYVQQVQYVMTSFESVSGLGNAAPFTLVALKSMTKHFQCLKNAIADQLRFTDRTSVNESHSKEQMNRYVGVTSGLCFQGVVHGSGSMGQANVWRPQRGLPERAVAVLKAWLFEHFLHPYPTDTDKHMLAKQTGLSRNQVSNWFINARVRLWKPLVEEIHSLEVRQTRRVPDTNNNDVAKQHHHFPSALESNCSKLPMQNTGAGKNEDPPQKRFRNEYTELSSHIMEPTGITFNDFPDHNRLDAGVSIPSSGNGGISLTLGLHQNNGICLPGSLPLNVARRFGLEESSASYVMEGYEVQDRQFSKDIDGQLLHDFVG